MYESLKAIHVSAIIISISLFVFRGGLMLLQSPRLRSPVLRILPHAVDTVLLASGVGLIAFWGWELLATRWLQIKLTLLVAYIVTGSVALRYGSTRKIRLGALLGALGIFALIVATALTRSPLGLPPHWVY